MKPVKSVFMFLLAIVFSVSVKADVITACNIGDYNTNYWYTSATMALDDEPDILGATHIRAGNEQYGDAYQNSIWIQSLFLETYSAEVAIVKSGTPVVMNAGPVTKITQATKYHPIPDGLTWNFLEVTSEAWGKILGVWNYDASYDEPCFAYLSTE